MQPNNHQYEYPNVSVHLWLFLSNYCFQPRPGILPIRPKIDCVHQGFLGIYGPLQLRVKLTTTRKQFCLVFVILKTAFWLPNLLFSKPRTFCDLLRKHEIYKKTSICFDFFCTSARTWCCKMATAVHEGPLPM